MNCRNCSYVNANDAKFCSNCGQQIVDQVYYSYADKVVQVNQLYLPPIGPVEAIKMVLTGYFIFNRRSTRAEFWWFQLFYIVAVLVSAILDGLIFEELGLFYGISLLGLFIPSCAVSARRLHDAKISGWLTIMFCVPFLNLGLIVMWLLPSHPSPTEFDYHSL